MLGLVGNAGTQKSDVLRWGGLAWLSVNSGISQQIHLAYFLVIPCNGDFLFIAEGFPKNVEDDRFRALFFQVGNGHFVDGIILIFQTFFFEVVNEELQLLGRDVANLSPVSGNV